MNSYSRDEALALAWLDSLQKSEYAALPEIKALITILQKNQDATIRLNEFNVAKSNVLSLRKTTWGVFLSYILNQLSSSITSQLPKTWLKSGQTFMAISQLLSTAPVIQEPVKITTKIASIEIPANDVFNKILYSDSNAARQDLAYRNEHLTDEAKKYTYLERLNAARAIYEPSDYQRILTELIKKAPREAFVFFYQHDNNDILDIYNYIELQLIARILVEKLIFSQENTQQILYNTTYLLILLSMPLNPLNKNLKDDLLSELYDVSKNNNIPTTLLFIHEKVSANLQNLLLSKCTNTEKTELTTTKKIHKNYGNKTRNIENPDTQLHLIYEKFPDNLLFPTNVVTNKTPPLVYMMLNIILEKLANLRESEAWNPDLWKDNGLGNQLIAFLCDARLLNTALPLTNEFNAYQYAEALQNVKAHPPKPFTFPDKFAKAVILISHATKDMTPIECLFDGIISLRRGYNYTFTPSESAWVINHIARFIPVDNTKVAELNYYLIERPILTDKDYLTLESPTTPVNIETITAFIIKANECEKLMEGTVQKEYITAALRAFKALLNSDKNKAELNDLKQIFNSTIAPYLTETLVTSLNSQLITRLFPSTNENVSTNENTFFSPAADLNEKNPPTPQDILKTVKETQSFLNHQSIHQSVRPQ